MPADDANRIVHNSYQPQFMKRLETLTHGHRHSEVFRAFCHLAACALAPPDLFNPGKTVREAEYMEEARRWKKDELIVFSEALAQLIADMECRPFDEVLGHTYLEWQSLTAKQARGEFYTPQSVCELMAEMTFGDDLRRKLADSSEPITVQEPACGAGGMILAIGKVAGEHRRRLRVVAIDVNRTACDMTLINTTLWGIPCEVIHGNTISLEIWGHWMNFPGSMVHWPKTERQPEPAEVVPVTPGPPPPWTQYEFDLDLPKSA